MQLHRGLDKAPSNGDLGVQIGTRIVVHHSQKTLADQQICVALDEMLGTGSDCSDWRWAYQQALAILLQQIFQVHLPSFQGGAQAEDHGPQKKSQERLTLWQVLPS